MDDQTQPKSYELNPSWKQFFLAYLLCCITIPIGVGLIALYFVRKKHKRIKYIISDTYIIAIDAKYEHRVDLVDIRNITLQKSWLQQQLGIGTLILHTSAAKMRLAGLEKPEQIKEILEQAVEAESERQKKQQKTKPKPPEYEPGNMEKINYLTGLWQQGLISEQDFEEERKHFE